MASGSTCTQAFAFSPTTSGPQTAKAVFSTTAGQSVTANFSATATNLILTTTTIALNGSGTVNYGQTATYTVTLTPSSTGSAAPTGSIAFIVDGNTVSTQMVSSNPYTFTATLAVGTHSIAANYSGDSIYASSNGSTLITVGKAVTTTTVSSSQSASGIVLSAHSEHSAGFFERRSRSATDCEAHHKWNGYALRHDHFQEWQHDAGHGESVCSGQRCCQHHDKHDYIYQLRLHGLLPRRWTLRACYGYGDRRS